MVPQTVGFTYQYETVTSCKPFSVVSCSPAPQRHPVRTPWNPSIFLSCSHGAGFALSKPRAKNGLV